MTSKFSIDNRDLLQRISSGEAVVGIDFGNLIVRELAAFRLAAMDSEPVGMFRKSAVGYTHSYHEDAVPLYRHAQPAPDGEQLAIENFRSAMEGIGHISRTLEETFGGLHGTHVEPDVLAECKAICDAIYAAYGHAQPAPVVPDAYVRDERGRMMLNGVCEPKIGFSAGWNACRSAMLQESQKSAGASNNCRSSENVQVVQDVSLCSTKAAPALDSPPKTAESRGGNSPVIPDGYVMVPVQDEFLSAEQNASGMFELSEDCMCRLAVALSQQSKWLVTPPGYVMVPKEPTDEMISSGIAAHYNRSQIQIHDRPAPGPMECAYVAMLAAADCSIPMISDRWIPVSERAPEEGGRYWCYVEEQNSLGKSHYQWNCSWNGDVWSDNALTGRVTHWMPLPAAPQEEKP